VKEMAAFIGGNLADMESSAARLVDSGAVAVDTGNETQRAAVALSEAIETAMGDLIRAFEGVAGVLSDDIAQSHTQLVGTDWQGASRENAIAIKESLQGQVKTVLEAATGNLTAEQAAFKGRAADLVTHVESQFQRVMGEVETQYAALAQASRDTKANLEAADQTIMAG